MMRFIALSLSRAAARDHRNHRAREPSHRRIDFLVILSGAKDPSAAEPQTALDAVILSRRSAAKNLSLRSLRSFAVFAAQDDGPWAEVRQWAIAPRCFR